MKPLIVCATREEIAESIPYLEQHNIDYLITGVGMVATTHALTKHLMSHSYAYLLNVGIAGAIDKTIHLGDLVEIDTDIFSELGAEDGASFLPIEELGFGQSTYRKINHALIKSNLPCYTGITVNTIHGAAASVSRVKSLFPNAAIESMEGAAIFYTAAQLQVPALQVRAISNYVEKRDKTLWNIPLSIRNLNSWLISYLQKSLS